MAIQTYGQVSPAELLIFSATIHAGLDAALTEEIGDIQYPQICFTKPVDMPGPSGEGAVPYGQRIPDEVIFPFSPPTGQMEELDGNSPGTYHPLVRASIRVKVKEYHLGYKIGKKDFLNDIYGTVAAVPKKLARGARKLGDTLIAKLLRNGKTTRDYTGTNFFAAGKPSSPSGARTGTFRNLFTGLALTSINLGSVVAEMMSYVNEDGYSLNVIPDTLIIPPNLVPEATIATKLVTNVFSDGNPAPGQAAGTAAQGANWIAVAGLIKRIIVLPELLIGGAALDRKTWYVAETANPARGGAMGLLYAESNHVEYIQAMDPASYTVMALNEYAWAVRRFAGAGVGLPQLISRCESP